MFHIYNCSNFSNFHLLWIILSRFKLLKTGRVYTFIPRMLMSAVNSDVLTSSHYLTLWSMSSCCMINLVSYVLYKLECYILRRRTVLKFGMWWRECSTVIKPGVGRPENAGVVIYSTYIFVCVCMFVTFPGNLQPNCTRASLQLPCKLCW
jgi:hypothetical protein